MRNTLKNSLMFIMILFLTLVLPFNVEAKQTNTYIEDSNFDREELISGDTISISESVFYSPIEEQNFKLYDKDKVIRIEYYIIDGVDSNGNIKYKKYDYSTSNKSAWNPKSSSYFIWSGDIYDDFTFDATEDYYNSCSRDDDLFYSDYDGVCNVILPAVNGKIVRWKFDSKTQEDRKNIDVCSYKDFYRTTYFPCDKTQDMTDSTYIGKYDYYTSTVYKFYEISLEKPKLKITCDNNKLSAGKTTKCKINFSYKYGLSNLLFDITSDNLRIENLQINNYWEDDEDYDEDYSVNYSKYWTTNETDNGYSIGFTYDERVNDFENDPLIATFDIIADEDIDDVVKSIEKSDIKYVEKTGDGIATDKEPVVDDKIDSVINPETFRNNYYLIIGIVIIGGICFIQLRSKAKGK